MIEKLGHSKRIQVMRREWIDEEKPGVSRDSGVTREELEKSSARPTPAKPTATPSSNTEVQEGSAEDLFMPNNETARPTTSHPEPEEDDLDDLLREDEPMTDIPPNTSIPSRTPHHDNDFDDFDADYEAMKELGM